VRTNRTPLARRGLDVVCDVVVSIDLYTETQRQSHGATHPGTPMSARRAEVHVQTVDASTCVLSQRRPMHLQNDPPMQDGQALHGGA
jgi:hypothetical protein